ncbi:hypothetical protein [Pyrobaculum aerophilum]|uniref:hypothetical protein n=1 Tax=Pyrobaculum aerophilum TaxID=13773 RepID=UPI0011C06816|nr:hypothetical protein [Pyrobaculum aerophilum]
MYHLADFLDIEGREFVKRCAGSGVWTVEVSVEGIAVLHLERAERLTPPIRQAVATGFGKKVYQF